MAPKSVIITRLAEEDVLSQFSWWSTNRSVEQANRWLVGIYTEMLRLRNSAEQHPLATEIPLRILGVRQFNYGVSSRPTHRIVYAIKEPSVVVYRVRSLHQDSLSQKDLTE